MKIAPANPLIPDPSEVHGLQAGVNHRVADVGVAEPVLNPPGINALGRKVVTTTVTQLVGMDPASGQRLIADPLHHAREAHRRPRTSTL
mgnify:CR=1 FL=1